MKLPETNSTTFAQDTRMTPGILNIIAKIANNSVTTFRERELASQKYYKALMKAVSPEQKPTKPLPKTQKLKK